MWTKLRTAWIAGASGLALGGSVQAETLAEAVALAYQTNPTLRAQRAQQRAVDETVIQARAGFSPQASAGANASFSDGFDRPSVDAIGLQLQIAQPLYTGGRTSAAIAGARADVLSGREQLRTVEANVLLNVVAAYVDVRRDEEGLRIRQENVAVLRRQLEEARARFEVGEITRTDVAQAEARLALSEANLAVSGATLANSRANYASVVGQNPGELAPEPPLPPLPATVEQAFAIAEAENPSIRTADFGELAARARTRSARAEYAPSVRLSGGLSARQSPIDVDRVFGVVDNIDDEVSISLDASVPLFTGGLNASRVRQALESENTARFQIEEARRTVLNNVAQAWNQLIGARASFVSNEEQVRAARVAFEGLQAEAQVGLRTTLDVLNGQQELRNAELLLVGSRRDAYVAAASVLAAMGRLEAENLIAGVPIYDPAVTVRRDGLWDGALPYEGVLERIDKVGAPDLERPRPPRGDQRPRPEAPLDPTVEWRPKSAPRVGPPPLRPSNAPPVLPAPLSRAPARVGGF